MRKVTIIGAGAVGSAIGYLLVAEEVASEIVFIDVNKDKAAGEAMDIYQATPFLSPTKVIEGSYEDAEGSDIVIITSGVARKPGQTRIDLAKTNVNIINSISKDIAKVCPNAIYIIVANPVDVLTYAFIKASGIPANKVIGSGTSLDTARLKAKLAEIFKINSMQIDAFCFGEHGDTQFIPWSLARIGGVPIDEYHKAMTTKYTELVEFNKDEVYDYVKKSGGYIIQRKGATYNGVASAVTYICKSIFSGADTILCISSLLNGEYGVKDVCLSTLAVVSSEGIKTTLTPTLTESESEKFKASAIAMRKVIEEINV